MLSALCRRLSYANVIATIALFIALGGTAYSAAGGNFILGQTNSAGTQATRLSANTSASTLRLTNTGTGKGNIVIAQGSGISGQSSGAHGVEGISTSNAASGLYGQNTSGGWAVNAVGNATQSRASGGFVKAMAYVFPPPFGNGIEQCFNSQVSPSQATSGDCGITFGAQATGIYNINFGFQVDDRIISVTPGNPYNLTVSAVPSGNNVQVVVSKATDGSSFEAPFYIIVY